MRRGLRPGVGVGACMAAAMLGACATDAVGPTPEERRAQYEATNVFPANYKVEIIAYLRTYLNDPTGIRDAFVAEPVRRSVESGDRFVVCLRFTPKKDSGLRPIARDNLVVFVSGKLDRMTPAREECKTAAYQPFPELEHLTR